MAELRIREVAAGAGGWRRVEIAWQDGASRRLAVNDIDGVPGDGDGERIRWYLEDYAEFSADPAPAIARDAEARLAQTGTGLFRHVFAGTDATGIWERARDRLGDARIEVEADPDTGPGLAWELLRDPDRDAPLALGAEAFVRTHLRAAGHPDLPEPAGDRLRVLLVICRPGGRADVPFRSVASRLVRGGADQMDGLDLDVLRPATFARLSEVLHAAHAAGRPYHVVHFDGHGTWADVADLGGVHLSPHKYLAPVRPGQHGYLLFEDPGSEQNRQFVDGPSLGRLLADTGVPVLVLNACRSAYAEAAKAPGQDGEQAKDVHARIKAYGSLAAEIADIGVPGVVAMRYNVYVVTAAQYMADLYGHLLAGRSLGQAATAARRALAADPVRQIGESAVSLQDWVVPLVYEAAPLVLLRPTEREAPLIRLSGSERREDGELPRSPDAGFFGRDETLLALDRAFDTQRAVLLHAYAGAGKSSTAAEFARWYQSTGGLGQGTVLWSSFEHHLPADRAIDMVGDHFASLLEANGIAWQAITDARQRRDLVMQVLAQIPVLWVWDNVEPVTGFPAGTPSAWTEEEQQELTDLLRDLTQRTRCKILLTSRREEDAWLGDLVTRVWLPSMPMQESLQLAAALAARRGAGKAGTDWRPLLHYAGGNPLTITVLVGQVLRERLVGSEEAEDFVARLKAGEARLEADEDAALGRTLSLAASLDYGFAHAFTDAERAQLAVLHLFRDTVDVDALRLMGVGDDAVPELAGLTHEACVALLNRAADIGLLTSIGGGYYQIHPALPWYFTSLFDASYGEPAAERATRIYAYAIGHLGLRYQERAEVGEVAQVIVPLRAEESNLLHALTLARAGGMWRTAARCLRGLSVLYGRTGRDGEWARLIAEVYPDFANPATGGPLPGREEDWGPIVTWQARLATAAQDWPRAVGLLTVLADRYRAMAAEGLAAPATALTPVQRNQIGTLSSAVNQIGQILLRQGDRGCLTYLQEALALVQKAGDRTAEAQVAGSLGNAYLHVPDLLDLDQAQHWFEHSLNLRPESDRFGRALNLNSLGTVALERFGDSKRTGEANPVLLEHLNNALHNYQQSLALTLDEDHETRGITENQLGMVFRSAGQTDQALRHYQRSIRHEEARGDIYHAGSTRYNVALLLAYDGRTRDALRYARAALENFRQVGPGAAADIADAEGLITALESAEGLPLGGRRGAGDVPRSL